MAIRLGDVELTGVQALHTDEGRSLVEQVVPGQAGSVFQDLGREPITIVIEGMILGEDAFSSLEKLRQSYQKAEALKFAADIAVGSDLTHVLIEMFQIRQVAGHRSRYRFTIKLREHKEPPEPAQAGLATVNAGIATDADGWAKNALGSSAVLQDPASLGGTLPGNPGLLDHLGMGDLGQSISRAAGGLTGGDFGSILQAVGSIDPQKAVELVMAVKDAGSLGEFVEKFAEEGLDIFEELSGVDLGIAGTLIKGMAGASDFLKQLKQISKDAGDLVTDLRHFDPLAGIRAARDGARS